MPRLLTRRRFLTITAAAAFASPAQASALARWHGTALGAEASIMLAGVSARDASSLFTSVTAEIDRLEHIFSLYRPESQISRLNRAGVLENPAPELVRVLRLAGRVHAATDGAFDPAIQPLWRAHGRAFGRSRAPTPREIAAALMLTEWRDVRISSEEISFGRQGMALTLNGIAQGEIADRVATLLGRLGLANVLVDAGEIAAAGRRPDGARWRADVVFPDGTIADRITLADRALATSAPARMPHGPAPHIFDPRTGRPAALWKLVSVSAPNAALADALSTAFCLMPRPAIDRTLARFPQAALEVLV